MGPLRESGFSGRRRVCEGRQVNPLGTWPGDRGLGPKTQTNPGEALGPLTIAEVSGAPLVPERSGSGAGGPDPDRDGHGGPLSPGGPQGTTGSPRRQLPNWGRSPQPREPTGSRTHRSGPEKIIRLDSGDRLTFILGLSLLGAFLHLKPQHPNPATPLLISPEGCQQGLPPQKQMPPFLRDFFFLLIQMCHRMFQLLTALRATQGTEKSEPPFPECMQEFKF